jgi:hypothetical protein
MSSGELSWILAMPFVDVLFETFSWDVTGNPGAIRQDYFALLVAPTFSCINILTGD